MAPATTALLLLLTTTIIALYATTATARPCKTFFFITSSSSHHHHHHHNPHRLTFFFTQIRPTITLPRPTITLPRPMLFDRSTITSSSSSSSSSAAASSSASSDVVSSEPYVKASIRERTMDVMSVVGAVLFGVGCGALTAATMYLFWSLFVPRRFGFCSDDDDSGDEAYVGVASATKEVPPSADEIDRIAAMK